MEQLILEHLQLFLQLIPFLTVNGPTSISATSINALIVNGTSDFKRNVTAENDLTVNGTIIYYNI